MANLTERLARLIVAAVCYFRRRKWRDAQPPEGPDREAYEREMKLFHRS